MYLFTFALLLTAQTCTVFWLGIMMETVSMYKNYPPFKDKCNFQQKQPLKYHWKANTCGWIDHVLELVIWHFQIFTQYPFHKKILKNGSFIMNHFSTVESLYAGNKFCLMTLDSVSSVLHLPFLTRNCPLVLSGYQQAHMLCQSNTWICVLILMRFSDGCNIQQDEEIDSLVVYNMVYELWYCTCTGNAFQVERNFPLHLVQGCLCHVMP